MAYHYATEACANTADMFAKINTFLVTTVGWTLHDDQSGAATPYRVYRSPGEASVGFRYLQVLLVSTTFVNFRMYRFWDADTHTGTYQVGQTSTTQGILGATSEFVVFFMGDLDNFFVVIKISDVYRIAGMAKLTTLYADGTAVTTDAVSSGSDVVIPVDDDSFFEEGFYEIANTNSATGATEIVEVTNVGVGEITVATLANNHPAGAIISKQAIPFALFNHTTNADVVFTFRINDTAGTTAVSGTSAAPATAVLSPDAIEAKFQLWPGWVYYPTDNMVYGHPSVIFKISTTDLSSEDLITVNGTEYIVFNATRSPFSTAGRTAIKKGSVA